MKEFFENLKNIRLQKGLDLNEIATRTRLPLKYLKAIERGDLDELPAGYQRMFFKRYLKEIGEDNSEVWQDFNLFFGGDTAESPPASSPQTAAPEEELPAPEPPRSPPLPGRSIWRDALTRINLDKFHQWFWIAVTVIVLSVVGYFAYQQYLFVKHKQFTVKEITVSDFIEELQRQDSLLTPELSRNTVIRGKGHNRVNVELRAVQRTWVREIRDGRDTTDYIMPPGLVRKLEAQNSVYLMLGRADGVDVWLNGKDLGVLGRPDEIVLKLLLTPQGIAEKRVRKMVKKTVTADSSATADSTGTETRGETP